MGNDEDLRNATAPTGQPPLSGDPGAVYKATVAYDGTNYAGWEIQKNGLAIQEILESAVFTIARERVRVDGSGRTDAGVHAEGQVASFALRREIHPWKLQAGMNAVMPPDVAVLFLERAPDGFHARFHATSKIYRYSILNQRARHPMYRRNTLHVPTELDLRAMELAAAHLKGTHDFRAFAREAERKRNCVRTLFDVSVVHAPPEVRIFFHGSGFLYNMVRILTGTLIETGLGRREPGGILELLHGGSRAGAGVTVPPAGLTLVEVRYGERPPETPEGR